jgi:hypothetical protein
VDLVAVVERDRLRFEVPLELGVTSGDVVSVRRRESRLLLLPRLLLGLGEGLGDV